MKKKRIIMVMTAVICIFALLPISAFAEGGDRGPLPVLFEIGDRCDSVEAFDGGVALIYKAEKTSWEIKCGAIDREGKIIIPCIYDEIYNYGCGPIVAEIYGYEGGDYKTVYYDRTGKEMPEAGGGDTLDSYTLPVGENVNLIYKSGKYGLEDLDGNEITGLIFDDVRYFSMENGRLIALKNGVFGVVAVADGRTVIPFEYDMIVGSDGEGVFPVIKDKKAGAVNLNNEIVIPLEYSIPMEGDLSIQNGILLLSKNGKMGGVSTKGEVAIPFIYDLIESFGDGENWIAYKDDRCSMLEPGGQTIPEMEGRTYDSIDPLVYYSSGKAQNYAYYKKYKMGLMDEKGTELTAAVYDFIDGIGEGVYRAIRNGRMGLLDDRGNIMAPLIYDYIAPCYGRDLWIAGINGRYTLLDVSGKETTDRIYEDMGNFYEGLCYISRDNLYGFLDASGQEVVPCIYEEVSNFKEGISIVTGSDGKTFAVEHPYVKERDINIYVSGGWVYTEEPAFIQDGRVLVPLADLASAMEAWTVWDEETETVIIVDGDTQISLSVGETKASVRNGRWGTEKTVSLEVPVLTKNGRTFVPVKFLAEALGAEVEWDDANNNVRINQIRKGYYL